MSELKLRCDDHLLQTAALPVISSGSENVDSISVEFDSSWDAYGKLVVFYHDGINSVPTMLVDNKADIPNKVISYPGEISIGVIGFAIGKKVNTTNLLSYVISDGTLISVDDPDPDVYKEILSSYGKIEDLVTSLTESIQNNTEKVTSLTESIQNNTENIASLEQFRVHKVGTNITTSSALASGGISNRTYGYYDCPVGYEVIMMTVVNNNSAGIIYFNKNKDNENKYEVWFDTSAIATHSVYVYYVKVVTE